jgi:hypothetical protein
MKYNESRKINNQHTQRAVTGAVMVPRESVNL